MGYDEGFRPRRWTVRTVLVVVAAVLVVCGGVGYLLVGGVKGASSPARLEAEAFVTDLTDGDVGAAYRRLCGPTRDGYPQERFAEVVAGRPKVRGHKVNGVLVATVDGRASATVNMDLVLDGGGTDQHAFVLVREGDAWKVCGQPY